MTILDSSVWIALLHADDNQHHRAKALLTHLPVPIGVPEYVILEVCSVLARKHKDIADQFLERIDGQDTMILYSDRSFFFETVIEFRSHAGNDLLFTDIALLVLSQEHTVLTFDQKLQKAIQISKK